MNRRAALAALLASGASALVAFPARAQAAPPKRVVWITGPGTYAANPPERFRERIRGAIASHGMVEGRDFTLSVEPVPGRLPIAEQMAQIERIAASRPDVIVISGNRAMLMRRITRDIPVVFYNVGVDPSKIGVIDSLRSPGGNLTGATLGYEEIVPGMWQLLKEIHPSMRRGGMLVIEEAKNEAEEVVRSLDPALHDAGRAFERANEDAQRSAASRLGIEIVEVPISRGASREAIAAAVRKARVQGLFVDVNIPRSEPLMEFLKLAKMPTVGGNFTSVREGLLIGTSWDSSEGETYAIAVVARILRGENPATIPVYRVDRWGIAINRATARALGIEIPPSLLVRAMQIFD